jgi:hypothetical protein
MADVDVEFLAPSGVLRVSSVGVREAQGRRFRALQGETVDIPSRKNAGSERPMCQDRRMLSRKHRSKMSPVRRALCPLAHASAPTSSSSSSGAGLGLRPSRPAFFFSRSR